MLDVLKEGNINRVSLFIGEEGGSLEERGGEINKRERWEEIWYLKGWCVRRVVEGMSM